MVKAPSKLKFSTWRHEVFLEHKGYTQKIYSPNAYVLRAHEKLVRSVPLFEEDDTDSAAKNH